VSAAASAPPDDREWHGRYVRYDLVKEFVVALGVVTALTVVLTILFSSPDDRPVTIQQWARTDPADFLATAVTELDRTSEIATYGPPYNHTAGTTQKIGPIDLQSTAGVHIPVDTAKSFVLDPLRSIPGNVALRRALARYQAAPPAERKRWTATYTKALSHVSFHDGLPRVAPGTYGPVAPMMSSLVGLARSGGLDGALLTSGQFYQTNYTRPLLFLSGGGYFESLATKQHLLGTQWGMMNETGSYPGQVWLWLYTFWYQIEPFKSSPNADALIFALMMGLSVAFICIPFIPGLRGLPRHLGVHRVIWRDHYRRAEAGEGLR
jgi:hypothetical protein